MPTNGPIRVDEIRSALIELGGTSPVADIQTQVMSNRGGRPSNYATDRTCRKTIQKLIEDHCPESANFSKDAVFQRIGKGEYRVL